MKRKGTRIKDKIEKQARLSITTTEKEERDLIERFKKFCKEDKLIYSKVVLDLIREYIVARQLKI